MQVAMSGLLGKRVVCVVQRFLLFLPVNCSTWESQDTTRMSMTLVVREDLCVYAGGA